MIRVCMRNVIYCINSFKKKIEQINLFNKITYVSIAYASFMINKHATHRGETCSMFTPRASCSAIPCRQVLSADTTCAALPGHFSLRDNMQGYGKNHPIMTVRQISVNTLNNSS